MSFEQATANRKYASQAQYRLGKCYLKKKQSNKAIEAFNLVVELYPGQTELTERARQHLADQAALSELPVHKRRIDCLVSEFPKATDLSSPESAAAAWQRAFASKDMKAVGELTWVELDLDEMEEWMKRGQERDAEAFAAYIKAMEESTIIEILTYREDLAAVICYLPFPRGAGRNPYSSRCFGRIDGQWRNLGEDRLGNLQKAERNFAAKKERLWMTFAWRREAIGLAGRDPKTLGPCDVAVQFLASVASGQDWRDLVRPLAQLMSVYADEDVALAITSEAKWSHGREMPCLFYLAKKDGVWKFDQGGNLASAEDIRIRLDAFLKQHPDAREVSGATVPVAIDPSQRVAD